ncbi:hypothetical protein GPL02_07120 [Clostridium sp. MCC334]|nr:hypothetical protein [Clostridium sp. MCC334]
MRRRIIGSLMAAAFIAAGTGIAALAAGGGYIQMESGKKENQVRISLDFSGDREIGKYMEDIGAVQVDLALETPEPEDITQAEFTFEASIQKDPDVKIRDGIFLEDTGRFSIFLAGNGTGDGLFNGGKKLELGVLQTASTEDITLRVERIAAVAGEELVFETDGGRETEFLLKATDPGEDQGENGGSGDGDNSGNGDGSGGEDGNGGDPGDGDGSGDDGTSGDGDGTDGNTGNGQGNNGGSGNGSGNGSGGSYRPVKSTGFICPQVSARETAGQWIQTGEDWQFRFSGGAMAMDCWIFKGGEWYHMGADSLMDRGWHYQKETGSWYYLRENGAMKKGWIQLSGIWYYLGTADGRMAVGWQSIGEKWYYLNPAEPVPVPATDPVTGQTVQSTEGQLPYGAMYQNRKTPDGFMTGADGAWME